MREEYIWLGIFAIVLVLFAIFSNIVGFHDSYEFITVAKSIAGIDNLGVYNTHHIAYSFITSLFLKVLPSLVTIKLLNVLWVFLIGLILLTWLKNKKAFLIFVFSPLTWYVCIQTTPILPASLFFLLSYIFIKKGDIKFNWVYSGLLLGLSFTFYTPMILVGAIFGVIYLWNKKFSSVVIYSIAFFIGTLPIWILDFHYFGNPLYSTLRYFGGNLVLSLGLHSTSSTFNLLKSFTPLLILIVISPLLYKLYKSNLRENQKEILFLGITVVIFLLRLNLLKYFFLISPIIILLLSRVLSWREIKWHAILSVVIIGFLTFGFFGITNNLLIERDLDKIISEFDREYFIAGPYEGNKLATFLWTDSPEVIWFEDYEASLKGEESLKSYSISTSSRIRTREVLEFSANFNRPESRIYENPIFISEKNEFMGERFKLVKCYEILCVYEEKII